MMVRIVPITLVSILALVACNGSNNNNTMAMTGSSSSGGTTSTSSSSSGGTTSTSSSGGTTSTSSSSSSGGTTSSSSSGGAGKIPLRGLAIQTRKNAVVNIPVPGAPSIFEQEENFVSQGARVTGTSADGITAELDLSNATLTQTQGSLTPVDATGDATLTTNGNFANGQAVPDETGGGTSAFGRAAFLATGAGNAGDLFIID